MSPARFTGRFTQQEPIPDAGIDAAVDVLRSGRLHRYNLEPGELGEVAALEAEYAAWQGTQYCLATTSGGAAMQIALRAAGLTPGAPCSPTPLPWPRYRGRSTPQAVCRCWWRSARI